MTPGNLKKRYIGRTDEPLCKEGVELLMNRRYPQAERLYVSPVKRCIQTAAIIYPGQQAVMAEALRECDFGLFENKNYKELAHVKKYQEWVDSGGVLPFPDGESRLSFSERCVSGFENILDNCLKERVASAAFVIHGGTIMSIMEKYAYPPNDYYHYQTGNGEGYELVMEDVIPGGSRVCAGSYTGGSQAAVSSGTHDRESDYMDRKNYKKISF